MVDLRKCPILLLASVLGFMLPAAEKFPPFPSEAQAFAGGHRKSSILLLGLDPMRSQQGKIVGANSQPCEDLEPAGQYVSGEGPRSCFAESVSGGNGAGSRKGGARFLLSQRELQEKLSSRVCILVRRSEVSGKRRREEGRKTAHEDNHGQRESAGKSY